MKRVLFFLLLCTEWCFGMVGVPGGVAPDPVNPALLPNPQVLGQLFLVNIIANTANRIAIEQIRHENSANAEIEKINNLSDPNYFYRWMVPDQRLQDVQDYFNLLRNREPEAQNWLINSLIDVCRRMQLAPLTNHCAAVNQDYVYNGFPDNLQGSFYNISYNNIWYPLSGGILSKNLYPFVLRLGIDILVASSYQEEPVFKTTLFNSLEFREAETQDILEKKNLVLKIMLRAAFEKLMKRLIRGQNVTEAEQNVFLQEQQEFRFIFSFFLKSHFVTKEDRKDYGIYLDKGADFLTRTLQLQQAGRSIKNMINSVYRAQYFWWWMLLGGSAGILGTVFLAKKFPHLMPKLSSFKSLFGTLTTKPDFMRKRQ